MSENHLANTGCAPRRLRGFFGGLLFFPVFLGGLESGLFDSDPRHTLRVVQSIGILLPLFAGLLRFTTNDRSDVHEQVNGYLLLGILGLVLAGGFATLAGMMSDVTGILKISLFFVFLTFTVIGVAAIDMLSGILEATRRADEQSVRRADVLKAISSVSTNNKYYVDRGDISENKTESQRKTE